ncbi:MAG TPA: glycoside hydrolase family 30 beta sandwich domain-containing protein [Jatrophihabitans sp.]|nr:glycoside hydrolase family 30 beta sandwich domain-containing protein [Jatrophihabitans sp.]
MTTAGGAAGAAITVDDSQRQQRFWGVGASITGASASLLAALPASQRDQLMQSLFGRPQGAGLAVLRQPLGANDFSIGSHTYDDTAGLGHFSLGPDATTTLPLVRRAQQLNPAATVVATPWSAPAWMKSNHALIGGTLDGAHYAAYAQYLARTVQAYQAAGIRVGGLSVQNEPSFSPPGYPGMTLTADQQAHLLQQFVRPALDAAGLRGIGLWALDDDYDRVADADRIVHDAGVRQAIAGVAFHCYRGSISAMADFHRRNPGLPLAISECTGGDWSPNFGANLRYDVQSLLIDGIRAGASWVTKWNVALDPHGGPTNGGCTDCRGVVTIDPVSHQVTYNEAYFALGHLGRFVTPGAYVLSVSGDSGSGVQAVAFGNPDGSHALLAFNAGAAGNSFTVTDSGRTFRASLPAGAVATFTW